MKPGDKWSIEYDNDTGADDESFNEKWTVTDNSRSFSSANEIDAAWLAEVLNTHDHSYHT